MIFRGFKTAIYAKNKFAGHWVLHTNLTPKFRSTAVITIKHVSAFVNKVEIPCNFKEIFDLIDKCRYVFYGYDGSPEGE